ncbi:MAG: STAS domain-containing protein [Acidimicrobiia bacterium]
MAVIALASWAVRLGFLADLLSKPVMVGYMAGVGVTMAVSQLPALTGVDSTHRETMARLFDFAGNLGDLRFPGLVVYRYDAPLCFANAENFRARVMAAVEAEVEPVEWVLLNMEANVEVDLTAIDMLEELRSELERRGVTLAMARVKQDLLVFLRRGGLADRIGSDHLFPTLPAAVDAFEGRSRR